MWLFSIKIITINKLKLKGFKIMSLFNYKIDIDEELRYRNYIHNHINNIKKAFDKNKE